jgi:SOCS box
LNFRGDASKECATLKLLYEFGSNVWESDADGLLPLDLITIFPLDDLAHRHAPPESRAPVAAKLKQLMSAPRSLQSTCRLVITRAMGDANVGKMQQLGNLPKSLIEYLKFEELQYEDGESNFEMDDEEDSDEESFEKFLVGIKETERTKKKAAKRRASTDF